MLVNWRRDENVCSGFTIQDTCCFKKTHPLSSGGECCQGDEDEGLSRINGNLVELGCTSLSGLFISFVFP
jgi:hypothetical protein